MKARDDVNPGSVRLRVERRNRLLGAMADHELDALVLSRPENVRYATGARQLWMSGTRPVGPACIMVRATGQVHLIDVSDEGLPPELGHDTILGRPWDPGLLLAALRSVPGFTDATTIGTDTSSPGLAKRLRAVAPDANVLDGGPAIWAARTTKTADEIALITAAVTIAASSLEAMTDALAPGVTERELLGVHLEHIASLGAPIAPTEGVVCVTPHSGPVALRRVASDRQARDGELAVLDPGAMVAGYEGGLGRTRSVSRMTTDAQRDLATRGRTALDALLAACRAGATGADITHAWRSTSEPLPSVPLVHGVGLGVEPPVIGPGIGDEAVLTEGSVLSVTSWVAEPGVGGHLERDFVVVGAQGPTVLSPGNTDA
jgi:Xaa-Pro aminopeptidase